MALELNKLTRQVDRMGQALAQRNDAHRDRLARAKELLAGTPRVTAELHAKINRARAIDQWRRGALPLGEQLDERRQVARTTASAILIAADGSQIYPDRHAIAPYYLVNTAAIVLRVGSGQAPTVTSTPEIFFEEEDLYDAEGQLHPPEHVNAQRGRRELQVLADLAAAERTALAGDPDTLIVCLMDGPLLPWQKLDAEEDAPIHEEMDFFVEQMWRLRRARAVPVGYVDRPDSAYVLRILELIEQPIEQITRETLRRGSFRLLTDRLLFDDLAPNERCALFTANSETNDRYERASGGDRIVFTYLNVARSADPRHSVIARIETPQWVAAAPDLLDAVQATIYENCVPRPYPYVLARAHELAVVGDAERAGFEAMLEQALLRHGMMPAVSEKAGLKALTGSRRGR